MSGIVERRESGSWVPRDGDGKFVDTPKAESIHTITPGEGIVEIPLVPPDQPTITTVGGPTAEPAQSGRAE